jgi:Mce-associated membrane protein
MVATDEQLRGSDPPAPHRGREQAGGQEGSGQNRGEEDSGQEGDSEEGDSEEGDSEEGARPGVDRDTDSGEEGRGIRPGHTQRPPTRELRWLVPAALIAVVALVAGSWFAVSQISDRGSDDVATSNEQAATAAGTAAQTIFSFTYDKLPEHLKDSKALMTKSFAKQFDKIAPALTELAPQRKIQVQAVTRDAGASQCGDSCSSKKANILVFVDQARLVGGAKEPTVFGNRISVSMVKQGGRWLVADIRAL